MWKWCTVNACCCGCVCCDVFILAVLSRCLIKLVFLWGWCCINCPVKGQIQILLLILLLQQQLYQISTTNTRFKRQPDLLKIFLICSSRYSLRLMRASDQRSRTQFRSSSCRNTYTPQIRCPQWAIKACLRQKIRQKLKASGKESEDPIWSSSPWSIHIQRVHLTPCLQ